MAKQFFEVFPTLKLDKKVQDLFEQVTVEKVSATKSRDFIRVTIGCDYLIPKETIYKVEAEIKKQFFSAHKVAVKLYERFHLSEQYTPEKLMNAYKDSILLELRNYSPIEYNLFKGADIAFPDKEQLFLTVEDTVLARSKSEELVRILEKIFNIRCGFKVTCRMEYKDKTTGKYKEEDDLKIARQVAEITARALGMGSQDGGSAVQSMMPDAGKEMKDGARSMQDGKKPDAKDKGLLKEQARPGMTGAFQGKEKRGLRKNDFKRAVRRSDNPDVLYGRDFEEDAMPIEDIVGEMGEVVIKGKIISFDSREIKNERTILMFDVTDFTDTMTIKMFAHNEQVEEIKQGIKPGAFVKLKGITMIDKFDNELT
ncbi:MAG: PolC-type DNA polymerase III, partial [Lachnospiraceae bacterium]|nr:PolC-type DNA polymerase III [Lachnospiraceae bacterium]